MICLPFSLCLEPTIGSAPECSIDTFDMIDIAEGQAMTLFSPNFPDHSGPFIPVSSCGWYFRVSYKEKM